MYSLGYGQDTFLTVHYYDENRNKIVSGKALALIGDLEGVQYISFDVNVDNTGEVPLELTIKDARPVQLKSALPTTSLTLGLGENNKWSSSLIDVSPFEGTTQIFEVQVQGKYTYAGKIKTLEKTGSISLSIQPDPLGGFDVSVILVSGSTDEDTDPTCPELWTCGEWGVCTNNQQMRECTDSNNCGTTNSLPDIIKNCVDKTVIFRTQESRLSYTDWIMYKGVGYGRYGSGSSTGIISGCGTNVLDLEIIDSGKYLGMADGTEAKICYNGGLKSVNFKITDSDALDAVITNEPTEPFSSNGLEICQ